MDLQQHRAGLLEALAANRSQALRLAREESALLEQIRDVSAEINRQALVGLHASCEAQRVELEALKPQPQQVEAGEKEG